jgi:hypothetical protein
MLLNRLLVSTSPIFNTKIANVVKEELDLVYHNSEEIIFSSCAMRMLNTTVNSEGTDQK